MREIATYPEPSVSAAAAGHYMSYLWIGHCIENPRDYIPELSGFHDDEQSIAHAAASFKKQQEEHHYAPLIHQMQLIVKEAQNDIDFDHPHNRRNKNKLSILQVHLVGRVSVEGLKMAQSNGLFEDFPALENVRSPFRDSRLIDYTLRSARAGRISRAFGQYATRERLLPGYTTISEQAF